MFCFEYRIFYIQMYGIDWNIVPETGKGFFVSTKFGAVISYWFYFVVFFSTQIVYVCGGLKLNLYCLFYGIPKSRVYKTFVWPLLSKNGKIHKNVEKFIWFKATTSIITYAYMYLYCKQLVGVFCPPFGCWCTVGQIENS